MINTVSPCGFRLPQHFLIVLNNRKRASATETSEDSIGLFRFKHVQRPAARPEIGPGAGGRRMRGDSDTVVTTATMERP
jgi:hypothetical protein